MNAFTRLLQEYVSFKSVSVDSDKTEIHKTVEWLETFFKKSGFTVETWEVQEANPVIFANYKSNKESETILIYGHYDVQPAEGWLHDPFILIEKGERLIARGVVDNKGQLLIHAAAISELIKNKNLKYNIKFIIEGNEETGSKYLADTLEKNKGTLAADHIIISDGEIVGTTPVIEAGLRGSTSLKLVLKTAPNDLHSGIYGGAVPNAAQELSLFLGKVFGKDNSVLLPDFYKDVDPIPESHQRENENLAKIQDPILHAKTKTLLCEAGNDFYTQTGQRPTLEITGLKSGYTAEGFANIVPATAEARLNFRFVASQDSEKIIASFEKFTKDSLPAYVDYEIEGDVSAPAVKTPTNTAFVQKTMKYLEEAYGTKPIIKYSGGTIPVVSDFKRILNIDTLLLPFGNDDCNMHGVAENFNIDLIGKALEFCKNFYSN